MYQDLQKSAVLCGGLSEVEPRCEEVAAERNGHGDGQQECGEDAIFEDVAARPAEVRPAESVQLGGALARPVPRSEKGTQGEEALWLVRGDGLG